MYGPRDIRFEEREDPKIINPTDAIIRLAVTSVCECVGTQQSMMQAIQSTRPGGGIGHVGVPHGVEFHGEDLFYRHFKLHGGLAPVHHYLPQLIELVLQRKINPGKVFDLTLPLEQVAEGYRAMDERRAIQDAASAMTRGR